MRNFFINIIISLLIVFGTVSGAYSVNITVDGDLSDWTAQPGLTNIVDPGGSADAGGGAVDIISNGISCDSSYLYFYFKEVSQVVNWYYYDVYIDVDNNTNTGGKITFNNVAISGAGVEFGLRISAPQTTWDDTGAAGKWTNTAWSNYDYSVTDKSNNNIIEFRIPLSDLGVAAGNTIGVLFYSSDGSNNDFNPDIKEIKFTIPLSAPNNVKALIKSDSLISLSWDPVAGATGYEVYRNTVNDSSSASLVASGITATSYDDLSVSGALNSYKYYYWVKTEKSGVGISDFSAVAESSASVSIDDFLSSGNPAPGWSDTSWNASGDQFSQSSNVFHGSFSCQINYNIDGGGTGVWGNFGMKKVISPAENWSDYSYFIVYQKGINVKLGTATFQTYIYCEQESNVFYTSESSPYTKYFKQHIYSIKDNSDFADVSWDNGNFDSITLPDALTNVVGLSFLIDGATNNIGTFYVDYIRKITVSDTNLFPHVSATTPANNSDYVLSATTVPVSFTIGANMSNIVFQVLTNNTFFTTYKQPSISYDGNIASLNIPLPEGTNSVIIDAINKFSGLPLRQYVLTFTTIIAPSVENLLPPNNSYQVATNTNIRFNIIDNKQVVSNSICVVLNGVLAVSNGKFLTGWNGANSSISRVGDVTNYSVVIDKSAPYNNNTKYTLTIIARDNNNNVTTNISYFNTVDTIVPQLNNFDPAVGGVIAPTGNIYFEADDNIAVKSNGIIVRLGVISGTSTNWTTALTNGIFKTGYSGSIVNDGNNGYNVTVNPDTDFSSGSVVFVSVYAVDFGGNSASTNFSYEVQSDFTAPVTTLSKPAGSYVGAFNLILSVQDESAYWIYYTTDGSDPLTSSTVISNYNSSVNISINHNMTIKYYSKDIYNNTESVKTAYYEILNIPENEAEVYNSYCDLSIGDNVRFVIGKSDNNVEIKVYNLKGKLIWSKNNINSDGKTLVEWNGVDSSGKKVGAGVYIVFIKGNNIDVKRKIIIVK